MADEDTHTQLERPRKRQRLQGRIDGDTGVLSDPIRRATRACDQCRDTKKRCQGGRPCLTCKKASLDCHYGKQARKRGFPTGYVRIIEALWALVFKAVPGSEQTTLHLLRQSSIGHDDEGKATLLNSYFDKLDSSRKAWLASAIRHEVDRLASKLEDSEGKSLSTERAGSRPDSAVRTSTSLMPTFPLWTLSDDRCNNRTDLLTLEDSGTKSNHEVTTSDGLFSEPALSFPLDAWTLIERYFQMYHSWLPLMPKHSIIRAMTEIQDQTKCPPSQLSVLWAIFALASSEQPFCPGERAPISDKCYHEAMRIIPVESANLEAGHVSALVLLTVFDMANARWEEASLLLRRTTRAILKLQRSYQHEQRRTTAQSVPNRTILAAFAVDTLFAARAGTIPQLRSHDISWAAQYDENEADEWEQWSAADVFKLQTNGIGHINSRRPFRTLSTFKQYVKLLGIVNNSLCDLRPMADHEAIFKEYQSKLSSWKAQLPKHCQHQNTSIMASELKTLPAVANLHFTGEAVSFLLSARRDRSTDETSQLSTTDAVFPCSAHKLAYQDVFGTGAWRGLLEFHQYASHLRRHRSGTKMNTSDGYIGLDTSHLSLSNVMNHNIVVPKQPRRTESEILTFRSMDDASPAKSVAQSRGPFSESSVHEDAFINAFDDMATDQDPHTMHLDLDGLQVTNIGSGPDMAFASFDVAQGATSFIDEIGQTYGPDNDEPSIETLLEELSAQQNVNWDEMDAQCMYNLGFVQPDQSVR